MYVPLKIGDFLHLLSFGVFRLQFDIY